MSRTIRSKKAAKPVGSPSSAEPPATAAAPMVGEKEGGAVQSGLSVADLKSVLGLIEVAIQRGSFSPKEVIGVGLLYEKISQFVASSEGVAHHEIHKKQ